MCDRPGLSRTLNPPGAAAQYGTMSGDTSLYEHDYHAWSQQQAAALRAAARAGSNLALDFENLAEEIEDLGKRIRSELRHRLETIIEHLLKLQFSPARDPRAGWASTVRRSRREVAKLIAENPSLRPALGPLLAEAAEIASLTADDLADRGEAEAAAAIRAHGGAYAEDQILGDWFPPPPG